MHRVSLLLALPHGAVHGRTSASSCRRYPPCCRGEAHTGSRARGRPAGAKGADLQASEYLNIVRARKWLIMWTVAIVTIGGIVVSLLQPTLYQGIATLLYTQWNPGTVILGVTQPRLTNFPDIELSSQVGLIQQPQVLEQAIGDLGLSTTPDELLRDLTVSADGQTQMITITRTRSSSNTSTLHSYQQGPTRSHRNCPRNRGRISHGLLS